MAGLLYRVAVAQRKDDGFEFVCCRYMLIRHGRHVQKFTNISCTSVVDVGPDPES